jgi:hypothetical protein
MACSYLIINVNLNDLTNASGNTNPSQDGKVFLTYSDCSCTLQSPEEYSAVGTFTASTCYDSTCITPSYISYYQNDVEIFSGDSTFSSGDPCIGPTPTPTNTETPTNTPTETPTQTPTMTPGLYSFEDCCDGLNKFNVATIPGTISVGEIYYLETTNYVYQNRISGVSFLSKF